jgi:polygalacturonase
MLNSYLNNTPNITNSSTGDIKIDTVTGTPASYDSMPTAMPSLSAYRKPSNNNLYNVSSHGAVADGITDTTTAFQNALNAAARYMFLLVDTSSQAISR